MSKNTFYISCPIDTYSGYSARARDFAKAVIELNLYDVKIIPQRWGMTAWGFIDDHVEEWGFLKQYIVGPQLTEKPDIWVQITIPSEFQPVGKWNIGLTAGIETTLCAPSWIEGCNRMDLILTSSNHSKNTFLNTKYQQKDPQGNVVGALEISKPIEVLIEGANLNIYKLLSTFNSKELYEDINSIPEKFAFLSVGHWLPGNLGEDRKNMGLLVKAFYEIFKDKTHENQPALILKTSGAGSSYMDRREIQKRINLISKSVPSKRLPSVYLLHGDFTDEEMNEIYNHPKIKAMVSLTKGEGFGRPLLEFSLVNKPIIASGWSGHTDFLKPEFSALLGGKLNPIHPTAIVKDILIEGSQWFAPDHSHIGHFMKEVMEKYKEWGVKGRRQGYYSKTNFSFEKMKTQIEEILNKHVPELPKKISLVLPNLTEIPLPKRPE